MCKNCRDNDEGIDIDENGLCDYCREKMELVEVLNKDIKESLDFDHSMNH